MIKRADLPVPEEGTIEDMRHACRIWVEGHKACERCKGTGNELFAMYKRCEDCGGSGIAEDGHSYYLAQVKAT